MQVVYATQTPPESWTSSIFLAGPTPRGRPGEPSVPSWRPEALRILKSLGYKGVVFVPETEDGVFKHDYDDQIEWEEMCLNLADVILFWIPRDLDVLVDTLVDTPAVMKMPAFTTNDEWGYWKKCDPKKLVLGTPLDAPKTKYQRYYAQKLGISVYDDLAGCCLASCFFDQDVRSSGERHVPLHIWRTPAFQSWYQSQIATGNTLNSAKVAWAHNVIEGLPPFLSILHVDVTTRDGQRRDNEVIICRPDTSVAVLYHKGASALETKIVMIEEFRAPVVNTSGLVLTLPGGSSLNPGLTPEEIVSEECYEEVGIHIPGHHFTVHAARQLDAATLTHRSHLFSYELSDTEIAMIEARASDALGITEMQEVTYRKILTLREILQHPDIDWSVLGMIASVLKP